ncbi:MAG: hypothetical protein IGR92_00560 [Leptolyngbyaceae cyanobacterium T60_A2020_046]|nr:hypothetical protein [Leptolyngbyaceae cyanobacterium T60_A2020_046]
MLNRHYAIALCEINLGNGLLPLSPSGAIAQTASPLQTLAFWSESKKFPESRGNVVRDRKSPCYLRKYPVTDSRLFRNGIGRSKSNGSGSDPPPGDDSPGAMAPDQALPT